MYTDKRQSISKLWKETDRGPAPFKLKGYKVKVCFLF